MSKRLLFVALFLGVAGLAWLEFGGRSSDILPAYRTMALERGDIITTVTASGKVNALVTVEVSSQLSGQIAQWLTDFNDTVKEGQTLARLDPQSFEAGVREAQAQLQVAQANVLTQQAAVERATAGLANARAARAVAEARAASARANHAEARRDLERKRLLPERQALAQSEVERAQTQSDSSAALLRAAEVQMQVQDAAIVAAEAELKMAQAQVQNAQAVVKQREATLDQAKVELSRTIIRAPIDGMVIRRNIDVGQTVAASLQAPTLFTIAQDLRQMKLEANVDEADIGRIEPGQKALFTVDAFPGRTFAGTVVQIRKSPEVFQNVVTYTVVISAANADLSLLPGMTAVVRIVVGQASDVLKVPNAALRYVPPGRKADDAALRDTEPATPGEPALVWKLDADEHPTPVPIRIGASDASFSEVVSGPLSKDDRVIVATLPRR